MPMVVAMPGEEDGEAMPHEDEPVAMPPPVPVEAGAPEARPDRDLKAEAESIMHIMTHTPKNPHCAACQRSKVQRKPCRRKKWFKGLKPTDLVSRLPLITWWQTQSARWA